MKFEKINGEQNKNLFRPSGKKVIWVRFFRTGKGRLERSLKTEIVSEARIQRDIEIAKFLGTKARFQSKVFLVEDKFPEFIELKKIKAKGTYEGMLAIWRLHLKDSFGGMLLDEVTNSEWLKYVAEKRSTSPGRKFFNDRKYLSMFLNWCHREGLIDKLPQLEDVDPEVRAGKIYSESEIKALLGKASPDLKLQILMAVTMGMRSGEILSLEWSQIDWHKQTIYLPAEKTKIRKSRTFGISDLVFDDLKARHKVSVSGWVFTSPDDQTKPAHVIWGNKTAWRTCRKNAKVSGRFHDLRHTFLTHAFKQSVNPALICEYAGLSLIEAQKTYLHFTPDDTKVVASLVRFV